MRQVFLRALVRQASEALSFRADFARDTPVKGGSEGEKPIKKVSKIKVVR